MAKITIVKWLSGLLLFWPLLVTAIEFDEIKQFDEVFRVSAQADSRQRIVVSWDISDGYYLYHNKFLRFRSETDGIVLGVPEVPQGETSFDDLLGEDVIKFHDHLAVSVPIDVIPPGVDRISLAVRSQGCMEDVFCYPPTDQLLLVDLPVSQVGSGLATGSRLTESITDVFNQPGPGVNQALVTMEPALQPEQAFTYEAIGFSPGSILVRLTAQPGYYLYRDKLAFRVADDSGFKVAAIDLPQGTIKEDPEFGAVEVYYGQIEVPVQVSRPAGQELTISLQADYQGCRDGDICYPPQSSRVDVVMPAAEKAIQKNADSIVLANPENAADPVEQAGVALSEQDKLARMLINNPSGALFAFFIAGLLLAFTPCVFPMVPILSGIIAGQGARMTTSRAFWLSLVYVLAMAVTYTVAGVLAGLFGQNLQAVFQNPWILGFFIAIFVALAMSMFGFFELQLPASLQTRLTQVSNQQQGGNLGGVAVMGFLSALIVGPCVAPPLAAALIVIGASGSALLGGAALFALSIGMGVPLILFGVSAGKLVPRAGPWMDSIKAVFGVGLLALAIWMLERIVQGPVILLLWGLLALAGGVYLGALERLPEGASGWHRLWKTLGLFLLLIGAIEIIGAASGESDWLRPLKKLGAGGKASTTQQVVFERVKSLADLSAGVARANKSGKPAMLDFYADWCVECVRMERNTFGEPEIQALFGRIQPLKADVTANDDEDRMLMGEYGIIGPPAILFFDRRGKELTNFRLVGYFSPDEFAVHLEKVLGVQ